MNAASRAGRLLMEWIEATRRPTALRGPLAGDDVFEHLRRITSGESFDYELREMPVTSVAPSQISDDYLNDSSRNTAEQIFRARTPDDLPRHQDVLPIFLDQAGRVQDGNHRHAAAVLNNEYLIPALVPVRAGRGRILNVAELSD